jgi:hypothetical protein
VVRQLPDVLTKLDDYDIAVQREWLGMTTTVNPESVWSFTPSPDVAYPWPGGKPDDKAPEKPAEDELKKRDKWESRFMPQGAILAARTDDRSWLTFGCGPVLPVLYTGQTVLMAADSAQAPLRLGAIVPAPAPQPGEESKKKDAAMKKKGNPEGSKDAPESGKDAPESGKDAKDDKDTEEGKDTKTAKGSGDGKEGEKDDDKDEERKAPRLGWANTPDGQELRLRMSGLLWPEAGRRLGHSAYVTRESVGQGQIILFAASPTWRGAARGTTRVLTNAMIYGPGLGASAPIRP